VNDETFGRRSAMARLLERWSDGGELRLAPFHRDADRERSLDALLRAGMPEALARPGFRTFGSFSNRVCPAVGLSRRGKKC
jgi:hypothetical protein